MRFSDFLLVSDPADLDFIVGYSGEQNIRIDVADFIAGNITGSGNAGYIPVFTSEDSIGNSQIFQDGSNIVIGGVNAMGYRLAVGGSLYALGGTTIESVIPGSDTFRTIGEEGDSFIIPNDQDESIWTSRRIIHAPAVLTTESATLGQLNTAISNLEGDIELLLDLKVDKTSVGAANGVASLDSGGKVPLSQIPDSIIGQVQYMGTWNALTNTPTLNPLVPEEKGHYYVVSVAGVFGGVDYQIGDWIISNGIEWQKVDNTDAVTSVFGRIGAILALEADYQSFYPRLSQAYDNPTWINSLAFTKITDVPPFLLENQTITLSGDVTGSGKTSISSTISNNAVTDSKLRDSLGTSVIGRASSTTGDPADIQASTDGHVLQRSGGTLLFGLISSDSIGSIDWSKIINTPTTLSGYGITDAYTKTETDNKFVPYTGANSNVNLGSNNITANAFVKVGGTSAQFLKADGSVDVSQYVPTTRSVNAGTGLTGGGNLSSDVTISFDTTWGDTRYAYRTRQLTINGVSYDLSADRTWIVGTVNTLTTNGTSGPATLVGNTLNIPNYTPDLSGYVTLATDQTVTGLKTIVRSGDVLNFKIGADTLYGLKLFYSQNEISPSGEATWSFVNTFNRDGSGYEVTPLSFFRGVLVTGERLVTSSINANLLDYYANNPTGRYPVYTYNTGVQQFANAIVVGETNGIVNPVSGVISDLPAGVVANFKGRVIGSNAVNSNEFVTLGQIPTLTGYVPYTGATQSVNLGEYGLTTGFLGFDLTPTGTPTTVGTMYWDPAYRTASLITGTGATTLQVGQEEVVLVHNNTGSALTDGQVVYVTGSTGNLPSVSLADASLESTSAATLGVVTETVANGADGFVTLSGIVNGLNTLAYNEGDLLWLSETAGQFTNIKPVSPAHLVLIGYVIKRAGGNGSIFVKIQNTQELAESSDVLISSPEVDGQGLFLQTVSGVQLWRNRSIADVLGYTPANAATTLTINGAAFDLSANRSWTVGDVRSDSTYSNPTWITTLAWSKITGTPTTLSGYGITDAVPSSRTLTINGVTYDLSANRSWAISTHDAVTIGTANGLSLVGQQLSLGLSSSSTNGALSSSDWSMFNNKVGVAGLGGATNTIPKFASSTSIGNSLLTDNGSTLAYNGDTVLNAGNYNSYTPTLTGSGASGTWGINISGNATYALNSTRLYASDSPYNYGGSSPYYMAMTYDGSRWLLQVTPGTPAAVRVAYSDSSGSAGSASSVPWSGVTSKPSYLMYYQGFTLDANTMDTNATGFTYAVNAPFVGPIARFSASSSYDMWINSPYSGGGAGFAFRTSNGDNGTINPWRYPAVYDVINSGGSLYASIYYDQNDTGYYLDPNSTSVLYNLNLQGLKNTYLNIIPGNGYEAMVYYSGGSGSAWYVGKRVTAQLVGTADFHFYSVATNQTVAGIDTGGNVYSVASMRSPILYDLNDTGYYVDPNGNSYQNRVDTNQSYTYGWFRNFYSNTGLYSEATTQHWSSQTNGYWDASSTTSISGIRFWTGGHLGAIRGYVYSDNGSNIGFLNSAGSWSLLCDNAQNVFATTSMRAPIFYDSNNTAYYADPNGTSNFLYSRSYYWWTTYTPLTAPRWDTSFYVLQSQHWYGHDSSQEMYLGESGNHISIRGYSTANGSFRSPVFYDSNDTFYFVDPNSTSRLSTVTAYGEYGSYRNDTQSLLRSYNTSAGSPLQFYIDHNFANVNIGNNRGAVFAVGDYWQFSNSARAPIFYDSTNTAYYAAPAATSRMLNLLLGGASATGFTLNIDGNAQIVRSSTSTALIVGLSGVTGSVIRFSYNGGFVGSISTDGSNTSYNTSSDYRLKEEIVPIENPVSKILSLNPVNFKYKNSKTRQDGFIAHELKEVLPYLVVGEKDAIDEDGNPVYQEVDYSKLTPILIAAIKELKTELENLKTQL